jgi:dipeptide/tripeptide permease
MLTIGFLYGLYAAVQYGLPDGAFFAFSGLLVSYVLGIYYAYRDKYRELLEPTELKYGLCVLSLSISLAALHVIGSGEWRLGARVLFVGIPVSLFAIWLGKNQLDKEKKAQKEMEESVQNMFGDSSGNHIDPLGLAKRWREKQKGK